MDSAEIATEGGLARRAPGLGQQPHDAGEEPHQQPQAGKLAANAEIHVVTSGLRDVTPKPAEGHAAPAG